MDLSSIISKQLILDKAIIKAHKIKDGNWISKAILALYVEIAELANEIQSFKYWKKNIVKNMALISEEYADGLHFLMSFAINLKANNKIEAEIVNEDLNEQFIKMFQSITNLQQNYNVESIESSIALYLGIAKLINLSEEEIEIAYSKKNKINFERIKNNY